METNSEHLDQLKSLLGRIKDLQAAANVLEWDQETYMPQGAAQARARQVATLRRLAHEYFTDDEIGTLLLKLRRELNGADPTEDHVALVQICSRDFEKAKKIPNELVSSLSHAISMGKEAWKRARENNSFQTFAPFLEQLISLNLQKAEALGYTHHPYDALLDEYEPGMQASDVQVVFSRLRNDLVPLVEAILQAPEPDNSFLHKAFSRKKQWDFGMEVIKDLGYDFSRGRQDLSAHPFTTSFSITDVRLTTRVNETFFPTGFFGTLHEAGHGLYEQGIDLKLDRTPLADGTSLGMHESQSRLWENLVGRSRPFWEHYFPKLKHTFPDQLKDVTLDMFYRAINKVNRSGIRVESDEVTYNLHIMLRFELELAMIEGTLPIAELPDAWNDTMRAYLGISPTSDTDGVLQDIHWSLGTIGYFPTYTLGNLMSTQLFNAAAAAIPALHDQLRQGQFNDLLKWLRSNIHVHGRKISSLDLLKRSTGLGLSSDSYMTYLTSKYKGIYNL